MHDGNVCKILQTKQLELFCLYVNSNSQNIKLLNESLGHMTIMTMIKLFLEVTITYTLYERALHKGIQLFTFIWNTPINGDPSWSVLQGWIHLLWCFPTSNFSKLFTEQRSSLSLPKTAYVNAIPLKFQYSRSSSAVSEHEAVCTRTSHPFTFIAASKQLSIDSN